MQEQEKEAWKMNQDRTGYFLSWVAGDLAWIAAIIISSGAVISLTVYSALSGVTTVFMHLYYIPIVLIAYRYRMTGLAGIAILVSAYLGITAAYFWHDPSVIETALARAVVFIAVGALVAALSEKVLHTQRKLEGSLRIKESILKNVNVWLMVLDSRGYILEWNTAAERMSGYSAPEVLGRRDVWKKIYPDREYRRRITRQIQSIIEKQRYFENLETTITCRDGSQKTMLWNTRSLGPMEENGESFVAIGTDITPLKKAEQAQRESLDRTKAILGALPDLLFIISRDGTFREFYCNDEGMLVYPAGEYVGKSIWTTGFSPGSAENFMRHVKAAIETKKFQYTSYSLILHGQKRYFESRIVALDGENALVIVSDISDRIEKELLKEKFMIELEEKVRLQTESLKTALREKETLLREVHHRVKNNLQVIISLLNLQIRATTNPEITGILLDMQNRIRAMALVHEKLYQSGDLSRIELSSYIRSLVSQTFSTHGINQQKVTLSITCESISMDIGRAIPLGLVINELVSNSLKYAFPGDITGTVTIQGKKIEDRVECTVSDDGIGLSQDIRIEESKTLGLRLVYSLVEQVHGRIERVMTERGTTFRLVIPAGEG